LRPASRQRAAAALVLGLGFPLEVSAHRTDNPLQAARIGVEPDRVLVTLDLTPGLAAAPAFLAALDRDRNGAVSTDEQQAYARLVLSAVGLQLDGAPLRPVLVSWSSSDLGALARGEGGVHLELLARFPSVGPGSHRLLFRNRHLAGHSAYLANALIPESPRVSVTAQRRTRDQGDLAIDYTVRPDHLSSR